MKKTVGILIGVLLVLVLGGGGAAWWWMQKQGEGAGGGAPHASGPKLNLEQATYVTLDKVVVMLKTAPGARNMYMSVDVVLRTDKANEKGLKAELPMLKGVAVRTLTHMEPAAAKAMSIDEWTALLNKDMVEAYASHPSQRLFDKVMVSRLIIE